MTIKEFHDNLTIEEQNKIAAELQCWLGQYTQEVFEKVMNNIESVLNNEFAMNLLTELYERTKKERQDEIQTIRLAIANKDFLRFELHNHPLEHSGSYRDILYDMFIK